MTDRLLCIGMSGDDVLEVQAFLDLHLSVVPLLDLDGIFGPQTRSRVVDFQRQHQLVADGVVGPKTRAALFKGAPGLGSGPFMNLNTWQQLITQQMINDFSKNAHASGIDLSGFEALEAIQQLKSRTAELRERMETIVCETLLRLYG